MTSEELAEAERRRRQADAEQAKEQEKKKAPREMTGAMRSVPVILAALALFLTLCFITAETGAFGSFISVALKGLFSYVAYTIPAFIALHAIFFASDIKQGRLLSRFIFTLIAIVTLSEIAYMISNFGAAALVFDPIRFFNDGVNGVGGGFIGSVITFALTKVIGKVGVAILILAVAVIYVLYFLSSKDGAISTYIVRKTSQLLNFFAKQEKKLKNSVGGSKKRKEAKKNATLDKKTVELLDDDFFSTDNGISKLEIPELGIVETKEKAAGGHILRESVTRRPEISTEPSEDDVPKKRGRFYGDFNEEDSAFKRAEGNEGYRSDDLVFEINDEATKASNPTRNPYGLEDSADAIFTADFNPFDLALNEKYANKPSSKVPHEVRNATPSVTERITEITPEDAERERRAAIFEERRAEALRKMAMREKAEERAREEARLAEQRAREEEARRKAEAIAAMQRAAQEEERRMELERRQAEAAARAANIALEVERAGSYTVTEAIETEETPVIVNSDTESEAGYGTYTEQKPDYVSPSVITYSTVPQEKPGAQSDGYSKYATASADTDTQYYDDKDDERGEYIEVDDEPEADIEPEYIEKEVYSDSDERGITVSRTMLSDATAEPAARVGLDFSDDEDIDDEELSEEQIAEGEEDAYAPTEIPLEEQNAKIGEYRAMFDMFGKKGDDLQGEDEEADGEIEDGDEYDEEDLDEEDIADDQSDEEDEPPFDFIPKKKPEPKAEPVKKAAPDYSKYKFPPITLLAKVEPKNSEQMNDEAQAGAENLLRALESFGIRATLRGIERGPRITRYSIVPAKGVRVGQIERLSDDISLALAAESIRIEAPIPGRSAVGVEIPNTESDIVSLRELLESPEFAQKESKTTVCIGKSVEGNKVLGDIADMPHLLIAGATGMGKSVCMNSLIMSMLYKARPDEVKFIMIDPKKLEFAPYNGIPHLLVPVVTEPKQAAGALMWAVDEMNRRYGVIEKLYVKNINSYNEKVRANPELGELMPKIVIFIDELNDLMIQVRDPVENLIMLIAQKARAAGIHLVIGTQRPSVNVITGVIKANIPSRIACKVSSGVDSRTILEQIGAEKLIGKGDMLYAPGGKLNPTRVQGAFVSESETMAIVDFVKDQYKGDFYDEQAIADMQRAAQKCDKRKQGDDDDDDDDGSDTGYLHDRKFLSAVELAINHGNIATSYLQRKLHIGYGKAAQYIDAMVELGIVEEKGSSKGREVLVSLREWHEKLSRLTLDDE